jgi:hypothetical protein
VFYQFRDRLSADAIDHYGIVHADGTVKQPIIDALKTSSS